MNDAYINVQKLNFCTPGASNIGPTFRVSALTQSSHPSQRLTITQARQCSYTPAFAFIQRHFISRSYSGKIIGLPRLVCSAELNLSKWADQSGPCRTGFSNPGNYCCTSGQGEQCMFKNSCYPVDLCISKYRDRLQGWEDSSWRIASAEASSNELKVT